MFRRFVRKLNAIISMITVMALLAINVVPSAITTVQKDNSLLKESDFKERNVLYYPDWSIWKNGDNFYPSRIPAQDITHLILGDLDFTSDGELKVVDRDAFFTHSLGNNNVNIDNNAGLLNALIDLRAKNPNLKLGINIGGTYYSGDFVSVCESSEKRANLINNIISFIDYTGFDFINIDWWNPTEIKNKDLCDSTLKEGTENASEKDKEYLSTLISELKSALDKKEVDNGKEYELSVSLPATYERIDKGIDVSSIFNNIDFANLKTYEYRDASQIEVGHKSPLYTNPNDPRKDTGISIDETVKYYLSKGAASEKLVIGSSYITSGWEKVTGAGNDENNSMLFSSAELVNLNESGESVPGAKGQLGNLMGEWRYNSLDILKQQYLGLSEYWDDSAKAPYLYSDETGTFFTYDNSKSIEEKVKYVKENNLGGMFGVSLYGDKSIVDTNKTELVNVTKTGLFGDSELPKYNLDKNDLNIDFSFKGEYVSGRYYLKITLKNNEVVNSKEGDLASIERNSKTLKNAKLYIKTDGQELKGSYGTPVGITKEGDYYVCDLSAALSTRFIKPQESVDIYLATDFVEGSKLILEASIAQRIYENSAEISKQQVCNNIDYIVLLAKAAAKYNIKKGHINWDSSLDMNNDGIIDIFDLTIIAKNIY